MKVYGSLSTMAPLLKPQEVLIIYALGLMITGALAFNASGQKRSSLSALYVSNSVALLSFVTAAAIGNRKIEKGEPGYKLRMIAIHWAMVYPLIFTGIVIWRLAKACARAGRCGNAYVVPYLAAMIVMSVATAVAIAVQKPKNEVQGKETAKVPTEAAEKKKTTEKAQ